MTSTTQVPAYPRLARQLAAADVDASPAEVHGIAVGLLCAGVPDPCARWEHELLEDARDGDVLVGECRRSLRALHHGTAAALDDADVGLALLLPDDDRPLAERAGALRDWCTGFLYGFGIAGVSPDRALSGEGREALRDFTELTRLDAEHVADSEGEEGALPEIVEFVRVAVLLIREDVRAHRERH
jgi:uncharacterized protein YgfB (UPF0149 family)